MVSIVDIDEVTKPQEYEPVQKWILPNGFIACYYPEKRIGILKPYAYNGQLLINDKEEKYLCRLEVTHHLGHAAMKDIWSKIATTFASAMGEYKHETTEDETKEIREPTKNDHSNEDAKI